MRAISRFGMRANQRAAEAIAEMVSDSKSSADSGQAAAAASRIEALKQQQVFESLVQGIDSVLSGGMGSCRLVRKDEVVSETVSLHGQRHYKFNLPGRPTLVTVSLVKQSGITPVLWGSTSIERPNSKNHDIKGKDDKVVYEHAITHADEQDEMAAQVDRRTVVPTCRELFVTVEAEAGECSYSLKVKHSAMKIVLTKAEIKVQIQRQRGGWESRILDLQREPAQREEFEEHILKLQDNIVMKRKEVYGTLDHTAMNVTFTEETDARTKLLAIKKKAMQRCARQDEAQKRREVTEKEREIKLVEWLNRAEIRRKAKLEQDRMRRDKDKLQEMQRDWLSRMAVVAYAEKLKTMSLDARELQRYLAQKAVSATIIHKFVLKTLGKSRRQNLYKNIVRARIAFTAYARHGRLAVFQATMPVVKTFLETNTFHREVPSLVGALTHFKSKVLMLQRWWSSIRTIRSAYVELFLSTWTEIQPELYKAEAEKQAIDEHQLAQEHRHSSTTSHGAGNGRHATPHGPHGGHGAAHGGTHSGHGGGGHPSTPHVRRRKSTDGAFRTALDRQKHIEMAQDQLPDYIAKVILRDYIVQMQKSHRRRIAQWIEEVKQENFQHDLEGFLVAKPEADSDGESESEDDVALHRPRRVYVDRDELKALVKESLAKWKHGEWREIRMNRLRLMRRPFKAWQRRSLVVRNHSDNEREDLKSPIPR